MGLVFDQQFVVRTDRQRFRRQLVVIGPLALVAAVVFGVRVAVGFRTAEGMGALAVPAVIAAVLLPLALWGVYAWLWIRNGCIANQFGGTSVNTWTNRGVRMEDPVVIPWGDVVVLYGEGTAVLVDPKQWDPEAFKRVLGPLPAEKVDPARLSGPGVGAPSSSWATRIKRQTGVTRVLGPFRLMHPVVFGWTWGVLVIAAIAVLVNLDKVVGG